MMPPITAVREQSGFFPLALLLAGIQLLAFSDRFLLTVVAHPLKLALDLTDAQLGFLQGSAFVLLHALGMPFWGRIADRGHRRALLVGGIVLWTAAGIAFAFAGSFALMVAARMLLGLGQAVVAPAALSLLAYRLPPGHLGRALSWLTASASLGRSLALLAGGAVLGLLTATGGLHLPGAGQLPPWRALLVMSCLPNLLALAAALCIAEPPARKRAAAPDQTKLRDGRAWAWMGRNRAVYLALFGATSCAVLVPQSLAAWAPTFYVRVHGLTPAESGVRLGLLSLLIAPLGHLVGGRLLDRARATDRRVAAARMLTAGLLLVPPCIAVLTLAPTLPLSLVGFGALAATLGLTSPASLACLQFLTPASMRGFVSAVFIAGVALMAIGVGPFLVGILNDRVFGQEGVGSTMLVVFVAVALLGAAFAHALNRSIRAQRRPAISAAGLGRLGSP
ncbi:MFS transporter [Methylobacterium sp. BTF04]|uniref:MFS transporter n=1 Tax=Methylobacterium sp. BTF04 TaxID=2708300 RepID=UPI0013D80F40|nr:MFS transporter [Methylobacterium sp. BTF04]NEU12725.1 MFS transporter [Methylobacterium sp. BTF04]